MLLTLLIPFTTSALTPLLILPSPDPPLLQLNAAFAHCPSMSKA